MKILLTAFRNTSSERLINCFSENYCKIILENDKLMSECQLEEILSRDKYDFVLSLGQRPVMKNKLSVEVCARDGARIIFTDFDYETLLNNFTDCGVEAKLSRNAGTSFCNNIYRFGLDHLEKTETKMIFVHIPFEKNISDFELFAENVKKAVSKTFYS